MGFSSEKDAIRVWVMDAAKKLQINVELHSSNLEMEVLLLRELHQRVPCTVRIGYLASRLFVVQVVCFLSQAIRFNQIIELSRHSTSVLLQFFYFINWNSMRLQ